MEGRTITRADLSESVFQEVGLSRNESSDLVETILAEVVEALARGESVKISSFGSFTVRDKGQRVGRNPKTGQEVPILPRRVLVFRASNVLKSLINGAPGEEPRGSWGNSVGDLIMAVSVQAVERRIEKSAQAFRTISEVATELDVPQHVLRFWESKFTPGPPAQARRRPALLSAGRYRPPAPYPFAALRRRLHHQGRAAPPEGRPWTPAASSASIWRRKARWRACASCRRAPRR